MTVFFSPSLHGNLNNPASGFFNDNYPNPPSDSFSVSDADMSIAVNLSVGSTYSFMPPVVTGMNGVLVCNPPSDSFLLQQAKMAKIDLLQASYEIARSNSVAYTSRGGIPKTYQADPVSIANLQALLVALSPSQQSLPSSFFWVSSDNTQVPFLYVDMEELGVIMAQQGMAAFANLQLKKSAVNSAATISDVQAVNW